MARCQCGALHVQVQGEPESVVACSCIACQRRTGSVLGVGAYYPRDRVSFHGEAREHVRAADSGFSFHTFFCPSCGTSLYWWSDRGPVRIGIAVGAFADPTFPKPERSVYETSKHTWLHFAPGTLGFEHGRDSKRTR